jgi:hypothetical protein
MKKTSSPNEQGIAFGGTEIRYLDTGAGNAVLVLQTAGRSGVVDRLTHQFRVIALEIRDPGEPHNLAGIIGQAADKSGVTRYCLIAESKLTPIAIAHAIDFGERIEGLVLIAPTASALDDFRLEEIKAPTLVLFGTGDEIGCKSGRIYARRIENCFFTLVYDAGMDVAADRPDALHAVVRDFLEYREKFVVGHESSAINP